MRVLLAVHHPLDLRLGAPAASLQVGQHLEQQGHHVEFFGFDDAFPGRSEFSAWHSLVFPWKLAGHLARHAARFDIVDVTTGDAHVWDRLGRPRARSQCAIVTRSNGIEHLAHFRRRQDAREGQLRLSWRYPIYHGGYRLWEVAESVRRADAVIALNESERAFLIDRLKAKPATTRVVPHGIDEGLTSGNIVQRSQGEAACTRLCFLGSWLQRKGVPETVAALDHLLGEGVRFDLLVAGAGVPEQDVLAAFPSQAAPHVRVVSRYDRGDLPRLLRDRDILVFPSRFEGFGLAVLEAMACGVVPIATPVGVVPAAVAHEINGIIVPPGQPEVIAAAVRSLASDPDRLRSMQISARGAARRFSWRRCADQTAAVYALAREARARRR